MKIWFIHLVIHFTIGKRRITESLKEKISKSMQKLVFFIDSNGKDYGLGSNIGNLYMNRFSIDEDAGHEIIKIFESEGLRQMSGLSVVDEEQIGMGHIIIF